MSAAVTDLKDNKGDLIKKSFVVTGITPSLNGSQDHLVRQDIEPTEIPNADEEDDFLGFTEEEIALALERTDMAAEITED